MERKKAAKFDLGKAPMSLLPFVALREIARVLAVGKTKYSNHNWLKGMKWSRVQDAMLRHYERFSMGEDVDPSTGLLHSAQMATNALFLLSYQLLGLGEDDRWKERPDFVPSDEKELEGKSFADTDPEGTGTVSKYTSCVPEDDIPIKTIVCICDSNRHAGIHLPVCPMSKGK